MGFHTDTAPPSGLAHALRHATLALCALAAAGCASTAAVPLAPAARTSVGVVPAAEIDDVGPTLTLGVGDAVNLQVYGRPELTMATSVAEDGTITVPLAGSVTVVDLTPTKAGQRVAAAFKKGGYLVDPQVTVSLAQSRGNQVSVLGAVRTPGRFVIEPRATVLDVLAQAGGIAENGSSTVTLLRPDKSGRVTRYPLDLKGLSRGKGAVPTLTLRGGDSLFVPPADQFYILGEVRVPNMYRLEPGMTVVQAISRGGGVTPRGSPSRVEIKRRKPDGTYSTSSADLEDTVQADDVVRVKERIF